MTVLSMNNDEIFRMTVLRDLAEKRLKVPQAAEQLQLGNRQVPRLAKAFKSTGLGLSSRAAAGSPATAAIRQICATGPRPSSASAMPILARSSLPKSLRLCMTSICRAKR